MRQGPLDLLDVAELLATSGNGRPKQAALARALSSVYYALFHAMNRNCADLLIGTNAARRSNPAWFQVYRSTSHSIAKGQCKNQSVMKRFPREIEDFGNAFVAAQYKRHQADYDPGFRTTKTDVLTDIIAARHAIIEFLKAKAKDRRAFAACVLLNKPQNR